MNKLHELSKRIAALEKQYDGETWMDSQDVCELLHISKRTIQMWRDNGMIPYYKCGRLVWYKRKDVDATIEAMKQQNDSVKPRHSHKVKVSYKQTGFTIS